ncbi:MAG: pyridoxal phosphate-dependent aminotransferase, partial [Ruminococcus sp.]|nr:pyridoxal phosphate-dependent aminotransferase [Candidatus Copronaster equi]
MQELSRKNKLFTDSVIRRMTRIAIEYDAINLAQGFPDFDPPKAITDRLAQIAPLGPHQYPITMGAPNFREALARKCGRFMGRTLDPNTEIVVTIGSTEAMVDTIFALTNPGDKIIMFSPYFENYHAQAILADCEPIFVPLVPPEFNFDANVLEDAFKQGAKAILICNPSNPSGKVFTKAELKLIADLCIKYDVYAIMDEVYEHIIYDDNVHTYMNSIEGMWERTVSCSSLSKT